MLSQPLLLSKAQRCILKGTEFSHKSQAFDRDHTTARCNYRWTQFQDAHPSPSSRHCTVSLLFVPSFIKPISKRSTFRNGRPSWIPCARGGVHQVHPSFHDSHQWFTWQPVKQRNVSPSTTIIIMLPPRSPEIPRCSHAAPALPAASPWQRSGTTWPTPFARACKPHNSTVACRVCRC